MPEKVQNYLKKQNHHSNPQNSQFHASHQNNQYENKQDYMTHSQKENKTIEKDLEITEIMVSSDKNALSTYKPINVRKT